MSSLQYSKEDILINTPFENPVPLRNDESSRKFNEALLKAQIMFDDIIICKGYQCALLKSKDMVNINILYTSEIDGEIKTIKLDCFGADFFSELQEFQPGCIIVRRNLITDNTKTRRLGILAHNGRTIIPAEYWQINGAGTLAVCTAYEKIEQYIYNNKSDMIAKVQGNIGYIVKKIEYRAKTAYCFDINMERYKMLGKRWGEVFVAYDGELYSLLRGESYNGLGVQINSRNDIIMLSGDWKFSKVITAKKIFKKMQKVTWTDWYTDLGIWDMRD